MSITSEVCTITALGTGSNTNWTYAFLIPFQVDGVTPAVDVFLTNSTTGAVTKLVWNVDYSITGVGNNLGGAVTYPLSGSPLASGNTLTIKRGLEYLQPFQILNTDFYPNVVEQVADMLEAQIQQLAASVAGLTSDEPLYTVATLPAVQTGARAFVTDSTTQVFGATIVGGGTLPAPVWSDGVHWRVG